MNGYEFLLEKVAGLNRPICLQRGLDIISDQASNVGKNFS
jgi:hypothetical protein